MRKVIEQGVRDVWDYNTKFDSQKAHTTVFNLSEVLIRCSFANSETITMILQYPNRFLYDDFLKVLQ